LSKRSLLRQQFIEKDNTVLAAVEDKENFSIGPVIPKPL
jgi:hypothetical protein